MKKVPILMLVGFLACSQPEKQADSTIPEAMVAVKEALPVDSLQTIQEKTIAVAEQDTLIEYDALIYANYVPNEIDSFIKTELKEWTLPHPSRWDKFWFNSYKTKVALVNFIAGDFNCDQKTDYALLMQHQRGEIAAWVIQTGDKGFEKHKLTEYGKADEPIKLGLPIELGLQLLSPGKYTQIEVEEENPSTVIFPCQAVGVIAFEKAAEAYYWDKAKYKSIQTGD